MADAMGAFGQDVGEKASDELGYRCILIATILSPANVEGRSLAKMASTRAFHDYRRRIGDDVPKRQAGQDIGGLPKSRQRS